MARPRSATPSAYVKADGTTSYRVRFDARGHTRTRTFTNRAAAEAFCHDLNTHGPDHALARLAEYDKLEADAATDALDAIAARFFDWKDASLRSTRTIADYRRDYDAAIKPTLGDMPIATITAADVQRWVDRMTTGKIPAKPLGAKSIRDRHALLHQILAWAANPSRQIITTNPAKGTTLPKRSRPKPKGIMPAEWVAIEAALRRRSPDAADLATFIVGSGWRWSEAAALTAAAVEDYTDGRLYVTMAQVARRGAGNKVAIVADGKAAASMRRISLSGPAARTTRARAAGKVPGALVFTNNGKAWTNNAFWNHWAKAIDAAGVASKPSVHALRHTHVGWMIMAGASLADIKARIGHANITTTIDIYGGMINDVRPDVLAAFDQLASGPSAASPAPAAIAAADTSPGQP